MSFRLGSGASVDKPLYGSGAGFYNPTMGVYRDIVTLVATEYVTTTCRRSCIQHSGDGACTSSDCSAAHHGDGVDHRGGEPVRMLDAFSGVGALALRWASALRTDRSGGCATTTSGNACRALNVEITANDMSSTCAGIIGNNISDNGLEGDGGGVSLGVTSLDAGLAMWTAACDGQRRPYEFVHLDPFGCCSPFLDAALRCIPHQGVLSMTATDTSALFDRRYARVARRHYGVVLSSPRTFEFREVAVRAVLAAVATSAARHDKGIEVLLACPAEHFVLIVVRVVRGARRSDVSTQHVRTLPDGRGPLYMGPLGDRGFLASLTARCRAWSPVRLAKRKKVLKLLQTLGDESAVGVPWFVSLPRVLPAVGVQQPPPIKKVIAQLCLAGFAATRTVYDPSGIRTTAPVGEVRGAVLGAAGVSEQGCIASHAVRPTHARSADQHGHSFHNPTVVWCSFGVCLALAAAVGAYFGLQVGATRARRRPL